MAKQQTTGMGVVAAAKAVSDTQSAFQDVGGQFMTGYSKALETKKEEEAKNKETQGRINSLMEGFTNDIDVLAFKPEEQKVVKDKITTWRNEYAELANKAGRIEDKTSPEYQEYNDKMNDIMQRMGNLKKNIDNFAAFKGDFAENVKGGHYSNAGMNTDAISKGANMIESPFTAVSDNGDISWGEYGFQDYKPPFGKAGNVIGALGTLSEKVAAAPSRLNDFDRTNVKDQVRTLLQDPRALASVLSDSDFSSFNVGDIDPNDPEALNKAVEEVSNAIFKLQGSKVAAKTGTGTGTGGGGGAGSDKTDPNAELATTLDKMIEVGLPKTIGGTKFTPIPNPYGDFKDALAAARAKSKGKEPELTPENLGIDEEEFDLFMDWYNGDESDQPIFVASILGQEEQFTYDEMMEFYSK